MPDYTGVNNPAFRRIIDTKNGVMQNVGLIVDTNGKVSAHVNKQIAIDSLLIEIPCFFPTPC